MSIDATLLGRQKKWKLIVILFLLAMVSLSAAMGILKKELIMSSVPVGDGRIVWSEIAAGVDARTAVTDSGVYLLTNGELANLSAPYFSMDGAVPGNTMVGGFCLAVYQPLGRDLYLPESGGKHTLPGSILSVSVGSEKYLSVIISASGYRTKTLILTEMGEIAGEITMGDKTMVESVWLEDDSNLVTLCLSDDGLWECLIYTPEGELLHEINLDAQVCYEMLPMKEYAVIRRDTGILIVSADGECMTALAEPVDLLSASGYYVACTSENNLKTYTPDGKLLGEAPLSYYPTDISTTGNRIYLHYGEGVGCYSPLGKELWFRKEGSLAVALESTKTGCILIPFLVHS